MIIRFISVVWVLIFSSFCLASTLPTVKLAALKFGTVKWELETIKRQIDEKNGFNLGSRRRRR